MRMINLPDPFKPSAFDVPTPSLLLYNAVRQLEVKCNSSGTPTAIESPFAFIPRVEIGGIGRRRFPSDSAVSSGHEFLDCHRGKSNFGSHGPYTLFFAPIA